MNHDDDDQRDSACRRRAADSESLLAAESAQYVTQPVSLQSLRSVTTCSLEVASPTRSPGQAASLSEPGRLGLAAIRRVGLGIRVGLPRPRGPGLGDRD